MEQIDPVKVIILGQVFAGKTALLERWLNNRFAPYTKAYNPTVGLIYGQKRVTFEDGKTIDLGLWDTPGSERYFSIVRPYYRAAEAAILCYDVCERESYRQLTFWIDELRKNEEEALIYICGCKKDLCEPPQCLPRAVDPFEVRQFAKKMGAKFQETSSKTGAGVDDLFMTISADLLAQPTRQTKYYTGIRLDSLGDDSQHPNSCSC